MESVLVVGATGLQGLPAVKELLARGVRVRGLTTGGGSKAAVLEELGAEMVQGDLFDKDSLYRAMEGMEGLLFIPVIPTASHPVPEYTVGVNVITAAEAAGVTHMVHTSVDRAGDHESFSGWGSTFGDNMRMYWLAKSAVIDLVKACKIAHWTVLKPAFLMDSLLPPKVSTMFPLLREGRLVSSRLPQTRVAMTCAEDQARLIAEAFRDFDRFDHKEIPLAGDAPTMPEVAEAISAATGKKVESVYKTPEEIAADARLAAALDEAFRGSKGFDATNVLSAVAEGFEWDNSDGYTADVETSNSYGVRLSTLREWCERHKDEFDVG